ncbi:MAG TPA: GNAT family protein [Chitinophagaceae bacterium]
MTTALAEQVVIHTDRLTLKSITPALIHELFETKTKTEICSYFGIDEAGYEFYREMHEKGMETHRISLFVFLLTDRHTGLPLGECGFHTWNRAHRRAELFYSIRNDPDKKKGYMTEALQAVLDYGFNQLNLHRVQALVDVNNTPSLRLLNRYGFTREGTMREDYVVNGISEDSDCYSLLKWEWRQQAGGTH